MPITKLNIEDFLQLGTSSLLLDVRSPGEFAHAHIPQAISTPLFTDEERKVVGTAYKQESKQKAVKHGLKYFGSNMVAMVEAVEELMAKRKNDSSNTVLVHCWRGGMRSAGVAWLLDLYGFEVYTLAGGYKAYRNWVLKQFEHEYNLMVVGGLTGCGKTPVLHQLTKMQEKMIDLEGLANHRGSAFGGLDAVAQPSQEMFENLLAASLQQAAIEHKIIWVENESQRIGNLNIPGNFFKKMRTGPVLFL
ncbi:MAG: tRNA 2-selenouridine(34) synthase MnmH, partial [Chitinophagaceae bacterium]|nr:tRNA 2-selenouridine(34) synthase MnmH [Chitinophagaceae bacterium]